tara:strand:+ start:1728 stop:3701 length:1974 start_codon:yes stop_codon:yes gene_type:complete
MGNKTPRRKKRLRQHKRSKSKIVGILLKKKNNQFHVRDSNTDESYRISVREVRKAFIGDKVQCSISPKGWAQILKVLESNTSNFIGKLEKSSRSNKALPLDSGKYNKVNILGKIPKNIKNSSYVKIKVIKQPTTIPAMGIIEQTIDSSAPETIANEIAISRFNLRNNWDKNVINEIKKLQRLEENKSNRNDLSSLCFVTIDGKSAQDFDDAVYAEEYEEGFHLYVAIADVSHYVQPGGFIDEEARKRGTSVYFTNKVIPMLPGELSNKLCSLRPKEKKLCLVCKVELDKLGVVRDASFFRAIIKSQARLTYDESSKYFEENNYPEHLSSSLKPLKEIYDLLKQKKISRKALELDIPDFSPKIKEGEIKRFVKGKRKISHKIIEECMLLANICAAEILLKSGITSIFRVHPKPDSINIQQLESFIRTRRINLKIRPEGKVEDFYSLIKLSQDRKDQEEIHMQILQSLNLAYYSEESLEHFALSYKAYTHFTSPIRRYPDLMVHRAIKELLSQNSSDEVRLRKVRKVKVDPQSYPFKQEDVSKIANQSSYKEREAEKASRDSLNTLKCELAAKHKQKTFIGKISGITNFGIFILLPDLGIEGLCHLKNLPKNDYFIFNQNSKSLIGKHSGNGYFLGDKVSARIKEVDIPMQRIDLGIAK